MLQGQIYHTTSYCHCYHKNGRAVYSPKRPHPDPPPNPTSGLLFACGVSMLDLGEVPAHVVGRAEGVLTLPSSPSMDLETRPNHQPTSPPSHAGNAALRPKGVSKRAGDRFLPPRQPKHGRSHSPITVFRFTTIFKIFSAAFSGFSCSQTRITFHPAFSNFSFVSTSRS